MVYLITSEWNASDYYGYDTTTTTTTTTKRRRRRRGRKYTTVRGGTCFEKIPETKVEGKEWKKGCPDRRYSFSKETRACLDFDFVLHNCELHFELKQNKKKKYTKRPTFDPSRIRFGLSNVINCRIGHAEDIFFIVSLATLGRYIIINCFFFSSGFIRGVYDIY